MARARSPPRRSRSAPNRDEGTDRARRPNDLGFELYRQHTLLLIMAARMRETAAALERGTSIEPDRLRRLVDVHRAWMREVRDADVERVGRALARVPAARTALERCKAEHHRTGEFEEVARGLISAGVPAEGTGAKRLAALVREEAQRMELHSAWEQENLHSQLDRWLPKAVQSRLLRELRTFDTQRIGAEIDLISWASQIHPSSD
jgi:hypothetical protein